MHEESKTRQLPNGKWQNEIGTNRYGQLGRKLDPTFDFERDYYDTEPEAAEAARRRSDTFGQHLDTSLERHDNAPIGALRRLKERLY